MNSCTWFLILSIIGWLLSKVEVSLRINKYAGKKSRINRAVIIPEQSSSKKCNVAVNKSRCRLFSLLPHLHCGTARPQRHYRHWYWHQWRYVASSRSQVPTAASTLSWVIRISHSSSHRHTTCCISSTVVVQHGTYQQHRDTVLLSISLSQLRSAEERDKERKRSHVWLTMSN
jgi:hypothetical protein